MAMKQFKTKNKCIAWLNTQKSKSKWIATLTNGIFLGITFGGGCK
jgi:hypothetical protein